jgi:hypothetical protein
VQSDDVGVIGTPAYMSPEQVRAAQVDARTDLYLVGCVTYELLTGEPPFTQQSALELCHAHLLDTPPALASRLPGAGTAGGAAIEIPEGFEAWLQPLLAKDPQHRPATARIAREQLRVIRHAHRRKLQLAAEQQATAAAQAASPRTLAAVRPPSAALLRRMPGTVPPAMPAARPILPLHGVRALLEVRQVQPASGTRYGPEAIEQIVRHVLAAAMHELREMGAQVQGPAGPLVEVRVDCSGDERGVISHLLDTLAAMQGQLSRIPEPQLEMRAAVVADLPGSVLGLSGGLDPLELLHVSPLTQVRVDEHVARWAGRRALVRLTSLPTPDRGAPTDVYATSLLPV